MRPPPSDLGFSQDRETKSPPTSVTSGMPGASGASVEINTATVFGLVMAVINTATVFGLVMAVINTVTVFALVMTVINTVTVFGPVMTVINTTTGLVVTVINTTGLS